MQANVASSDIVEDPAQVFPAAHIVKNPSSARIWSQSGTSSAQGRNSFSSRPSIGTHHNLGSARSYASSQISEDTGSLRTDVENPNEPQLLMTVPRTKAESAPEPPDWNDLSQKGISGIQVTHDTDTANEHMGPLMKIVQKLVSMRAAGCLMDSAEWRMYETACARNRWEL